MFKRGDLHEGKHRGVDSVGTYEQRGCSSSEAPVKDTQLVASSRSEDQREGRQYVLSTSPMNTNLGLGLGLLGAQNGAEENGGGWNNCGDGDGHFACKSHHEYGFVNKGGELRYNGSSLSGKIERMADGGTTNAGVLSRLSEEAGLGKARQDDSGSSTETPPACATLMEEKKGAVNGVRRKVIKRVEKEGQRGRSGDESGSDSFGGDPPGARRNATGRSKETQMEAISKSINHILSSSNVPPKDILKRTSKRFTDTFLYLTKGYHMNVGKVIKKSLYKRKYKNDSRIKISGIHIYSLCKHHLLPFEGECSIEYVPNRYVMGLSKFSRVINIFARRLQLQEDLTNDICNALRKYLKPKYIHVNVVARHLCINMRGVREHDATTVTNAYYGVDEGARAGQKVDFARASQAGDGNELPREEVALVRR
ncbi:GTP cyclohydrolase I, putative [Plasmodium vivax]|uniref:GTP cyclohydrolase 1 n=6 Tax=Plasmodium vivax TaxID=5855 RepID=A5K040_PLAVS|nr:GTP cyclohydrolase I, putative [Plasmodium vivax]KMZ77652.1 GTP cyclohydrolase I [Plasmodium vivax India VII]KMZ84493.1 GTP cyclohydrolase I [Plasmodium vivax Brazil I]KMZ90273.1 GTP cyclohydrolase I [Plasmodium vivax Mauritania I]KMZ96812.1 GTP cyclohydrolase I [Plasmodium vivax North Korean]EDL47601.1 GTP cyclohydrolase I, putative [Plasmodium vivax]|eukprot:XP_001617328.1 GTP cyclohydrolase I [Plasmodium vivax Sal-1]